jgi:predicted RNase H-like nuclease (RuvC/YqgF family)
MEMRRINALLIFCLLLFSSCISRSEFDKLRIENECLKKRVMELESEISSLNDKYNAAIIEKRIIDSQKKERKIFTEMQALQCLEDYYNFYRRDYSYRDPMVKRSQDNSFLISLEESEKMNSDRGKEQWTPVVWTLTMNDDGTYSFE